MGTTTNTDNQAVDGPITFDDEGDLRLVVGEGKAPRLFVVCSRALARASKPFKAMLYGGFVESKPRKLDAEWTVELPEDNPGAFATILQILHGRFQFVPSTVTAWELYQITILTDKYDMTEILQPWAATWIKPFVKRAKILENLYHYDEILLWIAWELGHQDLFLNVLSWLEGYCTLSGADLALLCPSSTIRALDDNMLIASLGTPEFIANRRMEAMRATLNLLQNFINDCIDTTSSRTSQLCNRPGHLCRTFYLGSFIRCLAAKGLYPVPPASYCQRSLIDCHQALRAALPRMEKLPNYSHCEPGAAILAAMSLIETRVLAKDLTEEQVKHLSQQASRSGLSASIT